MNLKNSRIAIVGLGYVGLPLAIEFGKKFSAVGFDISSQRIDELKRGYDRTKENSEEEIKSAQYLQFTTQVSDISSANVYIVAVPTPIDSFKKPDLKFLLLASKTVGSVLKKGDVVIYESTVYPGCTEEDCVPVLESESGLRLNQDFFCGYSPERINPGDKDRILTKILKITSGSNSDVADFIDELYRSIIEAGTYKAPSIRVAEAAKLIENCQRDVNISFVNELAIIFDKMDIDVNEVLEAAETKWNFLKFKPGLVGGHCISIDPYYMIYKAEEFGYNPKVIGAGREVNDYMPIFVANKVVKELTKKNFQSLALVS